MKTIVKISMFVALSVGVIHLQANSMKKYDVKSGKIEYTLSGSGNIMGMSQVKTLGKKKIIFDAYGVKHLEERVEVKKQTTMGDTQTNKTHTLVYMKDAILYHVNFKHKRIQRSENPAMQMGALFGGGKNLQESGESMMKKMGGTKVGTDTVLGYTCDVWHLMGSKQCLYKGIPLKVEVNVMGMKSTEIATSIAFNIALSEDDFTLPDFPIYGENHEHLSKHELQKMDRADNTKVKTKAVENADAMKGMAAGLAALAASGFDMKSNQEMTADQEQVMQKAMMNAMGGEDKMLHKMKTEILEDAKGLLFAQKCFNTANTLTEANGCIDKGNRMFANDEEHFESWSPSDKKELLQDIASFKQSIPCIKASNTMDKLMKCLPKDR